MKDLIINSKYILRVSKPRLACKLLKINAQFRTTSHKLPVENGRWKNIARENRICPLCNNGEIGDEFHYLFFRISVVFGGKTNPIFHVFHFIRKPPKNYYSAKRFFFISDKSLKLAIYIFGN
jgi:hypothetical protein